VLPQFHRRAAGARAAGLDIGAAVFPGRGYSHAGNVVRRSLVMERLSEGDHVGGIRADDPEPNFRRGGEAGGERRKCSRSHNR